MLEREVKWIRRNCDIGRCKATISVSNFGILRLTCRYAKTREICTKTGDHCDIIREEQRRRSDEDD